MHHQLTTLIVSCEKEKCAGRQRYALAIVKMRRRTESGKYTTRKRNIEGRRSTMKASYDNSCGQKISQENSSVEAKISEYDTSKPAMNAAACARTRKGLTGRA
jgi:hypothetical protein